MIVSLGKRQIHFLFLFRKHIFTVSYEELIIRYCNVYLYDNL